MRRRPSPDAGNSGGDLGRRRISHASTTPFQHGTRKFLQASVLNRIATNGYAEWNVVGYNIYIYSDEGMKAISNLMNKYICDNGSGCTSAGSNYSNTI